MEAGAMIRITRRSALLWGPLVLILAGARSHPAQTRPNQEWTDEVYPSYIRRLTFFGERPDWSHDGKRLLFVQKTFGDVFEIEIATGIIRPLTHHYPHGGYTRALYLANGDILLSGARTHSPDNPLESRFRTAELWILGRQLDKPPTRLGEFCWEGPAVSRKNLKISWAVIHGLYPRGRRLWELWTADIDYAGGEPRLVHEKMVLDNRNLDRAVLEPQNFRLPEEKELIFQSSHMGTEVMGLDLESGKVTNYSNSPDTYDEPEGLFPDGRSTLVESNRQHPDLGGSGIDLYRLYLDGSARWERMTWFNEARQWKATNPVVSDDGRYFAFQVARVKEMAGIGHGIYLYDIEAAARQRK
jgi:hypothetical protein